MIARRRALALGALVSLTVAAGCSSPAERDLTAVTPGAPAGSTAAVLVPAEAGHVHALGKDPGSGALLLASHGGLFVSRGAGFERVGPVVDLMGFTVAGPGHYYASGHPQPGTDLPAPVGLIESRDGGRSWDVLSRGGSSDFHSLTLAGPGLVGYDGTMRVTADTQDWQDVDAGFEPISLAGALDDKRLVASSQDGIMTSRDAGRSWTAVAGSPAPALVSRAANAVIAVTGDGRIHLADATGTAWKDTGLRVEGPMALVATGATDELEVVVLTVGGLVVSRAGAPFEPWGPGR